jgi:hypothetical protein
LRLSKVSITHTFSKYSYKYSYKNWSKYPSEHLLNNCSFLDKLFWISDNKPPQNYKQAFFFNIDDDLTYMPFNKDFGPLNLAMVHRYARELARLLRDKNYTDNRVFHYCTSEKPEKMVNGAFLMGCFMIIILKCSAE